MTRISVLLAFAAMVLAPPPAYPAASPFAGRWDLTFTTADASYPSWMEVSDKDGSLRVRVQEREGSVHPVAGMKLEGNRLILVVAKPEPARPAEDGRPEEPARPARVWTLALDGQNLTGQLKQGDDVKASIRGVRAPVLKRAAPAQWSAPESLFNGKDLTGWLTVNNTQNPNAKVNRWGVENGELVNRGKGHNIVSTRKLDDFKLHVEFNMEPGSNSGIYLRGRYECQMPPPGTFRPGATPGRQGPGYAIYGMVKATAASPGKPGVWRSYDITLVGRHVTLVVDGVTIVDNQEIPGITGGALDSNEAEPGPIYFQGDHTGGIRYRNITVSVPKS